MIWKQRISYQRNLVLVADWDRYRDDVREKVTGVGWVEIEDDLGMDVRIEAGDGWDLREKVEELVTDLSALGFNVTIDKGDVSGVDADELVRQV